MIWKMNKNILFILLLSLTLLFINCFKYSFKGALPSYLKTIYIPLFDEKSAFTLPEDTELLTQEVIDKFIEDNTLKIVDKEKDADLILTGAISSINKGFERVGEDETVTQAKITVKVSIECMNTHTNKPLWKQTISQDGFYDLDNED
ncbi:MAG: LptE family protein [Calditrichia bacterium]|nr:LptE family protein [Calditrichia bacterium]